jgi:hypothetical protein
LGLSGAGQVKEIGNILKRKKISPEIRVQLGDTRKRFQSYEDVEAVALPDSNFEKRCNAHFDRVEEQ